MYFVKPFHFGTRPIDYPWSNTETAWIDQRWRKLEDPVDRLDSVGVVLWACSRTSSAVAEAGRVIL